MKFAKVFENFAENLTGFEFDRDWILIPDSKFFCFEKSAAVGVYFDQTVLRLLTSFFHRKGKPKKNNVEARHREYLLKLGTTEYWFMTFIRYGGS